MDITCIDIAAFGTMVGTIITSVGAALKANKTESIAKQKKIVQEEELADLRERLAVMEKQGPYLKSGWMQTYYAPQLLIENPKLVWR